MQKLNLLLGILMGITILSCSSDEDGANEIPDENQKFISKITVSPNVGLQLTFIFEYNNNRLISLTEEFDNKTEYNYSGNILNFERRFDFNPNSNDFDLENERTDFEYQNSILVSDLVTENGNSIQKHDYELNSNGKLLKYDFFNFFNNQFNSAGSRMFTYNSENVSEETQTDSNNETVFTKRFTYDNQNNPLKNLDVQIRRQIWNFSFGPMNENNPLTLTTLDSNNNIQSSFSYSYQYDDDGYPISRETTNINSNEITETIIFEYL